MATETRDQMNRMYRWTRYVYNATRKYYLLGRDHLIQNLTPEIGQHVCEVGCGTARNLIKMAQRYPQARFYGLDAADEMLRTAQRSVKRHDLQGVVILKQAYAQNFDPATLFDLDKPLDKIVFSYALSIIPPWKEAINHAVDLLPLGGEIHIVDFGDQAGLPTWFRVFLFWWLRLFHVYHKPEILEHLQKLEADGVGTLAVQHLRKGYAYRAVFTKA